MKLPLAIVLALLATASPAAAATVEVVERRGSGIPSATAVFRGEGNEVNDVRYSVREGSRNALLHDAAAVVRPGEGCEALDEHTVRCTTDVPPARGTTAQLPVDIRLGGGDDAVTAERVELLGADGGPGDDRLLAAAAEAARLDGGAGDDQVLGGDGYDLLAGGPGADLVSGGSGDDQLSGDPADGPFSADRLVGGAGSDGVSYAERLSRVFVDLGVAGRDGAIGEGDDVAEVESVTGGLADDVLIGDEGANRLDGGGGANAIAGHGGDDLLVGSEGRDRIGGDAGDDTVDGAGGADRIDGGSGDDVLRLGGVTSDPGDYVACASGADDVGAVDARDLVRADCERIEVLGLLVSRLARLPRPRGGFAVTLAPTPNPVPCPVVVTVTTRSRAVRSRSVRVDLRRRVAVRRRAPRPSGSRPRAGRVRVSLRGVGCGGVGGFVRVTG